ncbi:MAG: hypothetical protein IPK67_05040 [Planctomycetes bacterium]|jgi:hypothetical protein|nr:hypothetical protein [Planctomycetota bacterium]
MRPLEFFSLSTLAGGLTPLALIAASAGSAHSQDITFSLDWKGPTVGQTSTGTLVPITEGDLLNPGSGAPTVGPQPRPSVRYTGAVLGLPMYATCAGHTGGTPCGLEVDALSEGTDEKFKPSPSLPGRLWFSVDKFAVGVPGTPGFPQVATEAQGADASADLFTDGNLPPGPVPPIPRVNVAAIDGDGVPSVVTGFVYPGLGLQEPNPPTPGPLSAGDNIDGLDIDSSPSFPVGGIYFSLDGALPDPLAAVPGSNSAQANGGTLRPGDVLRTALPGATPTRYAQAGQLGLDVFGPGTDDLDALILVENGDGVFQPSTANYDWLPAGNPRDMLMFSVRRGSAVIGQPDGLFGLPIEPGDILVPPRPGSPFPCIWIAAEALGLATLRAGTAPLEGDDVDALDFAKRPYYDCNHNGIEDSIDIAVGSSMDANGNGVPDECENDKMEFCFCIHEYAPCGNGDPYPGADGGCRNSTGLGGTMGPTGSTSVALDDLQLNLGRLPANKPSIVIMSPNVDTPTIFGDGALCLSAPIYRYFGLSANGSGQVTFGPGLIGWANTHFPPLGNIAPGSTMHFQGWYRDPPGPCGTFKNLTNAVRINFLP